MYLRNVRIQVTLTRVAAGAQASKESVRHTVAAADRERPLLTSLDIAFLIYYYPLRWVLALFGSRVLDLVQFCAEPADRVLRRGDLRIAERGMTKLLEVAPPKARALARRYCGNRIRESLLELLPDQHASSTQPVRIEGREHLEQALKQGRGAVLVALHCLAKREARTGLQRAGIEYLPLIFAPMSHVSERDPRYAGYGRLLWRFARSRLHPMLWTNMSGYIARMDPDAVLQMTRVLRDGGLVMVSPDVMRSSTSQPVRFLNSVRRMSTGALDIARLTGCPLIPMWVWRSGKQCVVEFHAPLPVCFDGEGEEARESNVAVLIEAMERQLRAHPEQWELWDQRVLGES